MRGAKVGFLAGVRIVDSDGQEELAHTVSKTSKRPRTACAREVDHKKLKAEERSSDGGSSM